MASTAMRVPTPDGLKASLFATIGPAGVGGIALSGHTDVVPVTGQAWDTDPVHARRARRQALRPRRLRHEGLPRLRAGAGAGVQGAHAQGAHPHRLLLRRGGGLHRRATHDRRARQDAAAAAHGAGRRADQHDRGRRPQGPHALERGRHRQGGALEHAAPGRQRHHLCRPPAGRAGAHGGGAEGAAAQSALRSALHHACR